MPDGWRLTPQGTDIPLAGLEQLAKELLKQSRKKRIWLFYGEMGAGKTTLIKTIARQLGVKEVMGSPTFSIVNEYAAGPDKIYHVDLYRLNNEREISDAGIEEYFDSGEYCMVEWPEKLGSLIPAQAIQVRIKPVDAQHRKVEYQHI